MHILRCSVHSPPRFCRLRSGPTRWLCIPVPRMHAGHSHSNSMRRLRGRRGCGMPTILFSSRMHATTTFIASSKASGSSGSMSRFRSGLRSGFRSGLRSGFRSGLRSGFRSGRCLDSRDRTTSAAAASACSSVSAWAPIAVLKFGLGLGWFLFFQDSDSEDIGGVGDRVVFWPW